MVETRSRSTQPGHRRARRTPGQWADAAFKYWALAPAVFLLAVFMIYPAGLLLAMSVSDVEHVRGGGFEFTFNLLGNIGRLTRDWIALAALRNTVLFVLAAVSIQMLLGFALAYTASRIRRGNTAFRTILMLPILVPPIAIGAMWRLMYNYDFGIVNQALRIVGLEPLDWLGSRSLALWSIVLVNVWHWVPFVFLIILAGLEALDSQVIEAATVDGANDRQLLRHIILPLTWPAITVALIFRTISAFKVFDEVFLLTGGGPGTASTVISWYVYKVMFLDAQLGYGAMLAVLTILISGVFILTYHRTRLR